MFGYEKNAGVGAFSKKTHRGLFLNEALAGIRESISVQVSVWLHGLV